MSSPPKSPFWDEATGRVVAGTAPAAEMLGWTMLEVDATAGRIKVQFEARPEFLNPFGAVQGGILAAMLDETMGPALFVMLPEGEVAPTVELKINFVSPACPGPLVAEGRVVHRGRSIAFLEGTLWDPSGALVATASATARIVQRR